MKYAAVLEEAIRESIAAKERFLADQAQLAAFDRAVVAAVAAYRSGGRLYIAGNGGSAADAQHLAAELVVRLARERGPLPAEALTVDSSILTAAANDYGYEQVFARQVDGKMRPGDIFLAITTSGESPNLLRALERCRELGHPSILFGGRGGGAAAALADYPVVASGERTNTIQELHIVFAHALCACIEREMFPELW